VIPNPLKPNETAVTSPYMPLNAPPPPEGTTVLETGGQSPREGIIAGNGAVYSFDPSVVTPSSTLRLEGWGFRNSFGIGFDPFNPTKLFVTNNGADIRSVAQDDHLMVVEPRPIAQDYDDLFVIDLANNAEEFFGWPDFFHDPETGRVLPVTDPLFCESPMRPIPCPEFVFEASFRNRLDVQPAFAELEYHSSANKFDFATDLPFGFLGDLFVAETGSFVPISGAGEFVGYRVVRIDRPSRTVSDFIVNTGTPDDGFVPNGFNKPIDVKFRSGTMLIVDFGVYEPGLNLIQPGTGKVWLVTRKQSNIGG
jgi:hypothetical protein